MPVPMWERGLPVAIDQGKVIEALDIVHEVGPRVEALASRKSADPARDVRELANLLNGVAVAVRKIAEALRG